MIPEKQQRLTGRPTTRQRQQLSEQILIAAKNQFLSRGYNDTTFGSIAAAVPTSRGALYNRFADKAALFGQVVETEINDMCARAAFVFDDQIDIRESLFQQAEQIISVATEPDHVGLYRIITREAPRTTAVDDALRSAWILFISHMVSYFEYQMAKGLVIIEGHQKAAEMFLGLVFQPVHVSIVYGLPEPSREEIANHIRRSILLFLGGIGRLGLEGTNSGQPTGVPASWGNGS